MRKLTAVSIIVGLVFCSGVAMATTPTPVPSATPIGFKSPSPTPSTTPEMAPRPGRYYDQALIYGSSRDGLLHKAVIENTHETIGVTDPYGLELYNSNLYYGADYKTVGDANASYYWSVAAGAGSYEMSITASVSGNGLLYLYENPTFTGGTEVALRNGNRGSLDTCRAVMKYGVTPTVLGTTLEASLGSSGIIGGKTNANTWLLKSDEDYLIRVYSSATGLTATVQVRIMTD